jgi:hypothetical protein
VREERRGEERSQWGGSRSGFRHDFFCASPVRCSAGVKNGCVSISRLYSYVARPEPRCVAGAVPCYCNQKVTFTLWWRGVSVSPVE